MARCFARFPGVLGLISLFSRRSSGTCPIIPGCTLESIAGYHVETIRSVQQTGPYYVGGWCIDGLVAYEVAQQLLAAGEDVGLLVLFDLVNTFSRDVGVRGAVDKLADFYHRLRFRVSELRHLNARGLVNDIRLSGSAVSLVRSSEDCVGCRACCTCGRQVRWILRNQLARLHCAAAAYQPRPYGGNILLLRRTARPGGSYSDLSYGWAGLARNGLEIHDIPGDHRDMFLMPAVEMTASILGNALRVAQQSAP